MKCSFCEQPLVCKTCNQSFRPKTGDTHLDAFEPGTKVLCPECQAVLVCKGCGYRYGGEEEEIEK
jgi:hypothetical protein